MQFPSQDLTLQYISNSYQNVVQQYSDGLTYYWLDGLGNVIASIPVSSIGNTIVTTDQILPSSVNPGSASWSDSSSVSISSSYANISSLSLVSDVTLLADTSLTTNGIPYSSSAQSLVPVQQTGSIYFQTGSQNLFFIYNGTRWCSASMA